MFNFFSTAKVYIKMSINDNKNCTLRKTRTFAVYGIIFRWLFARSDKTNAREVELDKLVLPSNEQWRQKVYYNLVELQRGTDPEATKKKIMEHDNDEADEIFKWQWDPRGKLALVLSHKQKVQNGCGRTLSPEDHQPNWTLNDILLAAKVLEGHYPVAYANEAEMRRVLALVFDVLRFKSILSQALDDINFYNHYETIKNRERIVLLLFYDMQARKPAGLHKISRDTERQVALNQAGYSEIDQALLNSKIALNASLARLRVSGQALRLDNLLPRHLRIFKSATCTSGWVNTMKIPNQRDFINEMSKLGFTLCFECPITDLDENVYNFDPLCPKVVNFNEKAREKLAVSDLVRNFIFIFLDRSFCFGAAALYHAIQVEGFCGPVVLTHSVAPRHVAYLSNLLSDVKNAGKLLVFGVGNKRRFYENYLRDLGITLQQCQIFSERYVYSVPTPELERATVVLATPSSSNTGVNDIIDLVIAKGGDINILESLTKSITLEEPVDLIAEQIETLKYALQQPTVQLLIYEVHSILPSETTKVVEDVVSYTNKMTIEKHIRLTVCKNKKKQDRDKTVEKIDERKEVDEFDLEHYPDVQVPDCDLFEVSTLSDIYKDTNVQKLICQGSFLAVLKRKEMMQFNSIFMIKYAEAKGLFGSQDRSADNQRLSILKEPQRVPRKSGRKQSINMARICADTQTTLTKKRKKSEACPKIPTKLIEGTSRQEEYENRKRPSRQADDILTRPKRKSVNEEQEKTNKRARMSDDTEIRGPRSKK